MHYSPDCMCDSCRQAGNRKYIGGGVYNIKEANSEVIMEEEKNHPIQQNKRGEWYPAIPIPYYGFRKVCSCGKKFWFEKNYEAHYALEHIIRGNEEY